MMTSNNICTLLMVLVIGIAVSCQTKPQEESAASKPPAAPAPSYPALGNEVVSKLYSEADHVDIIFYKLPISVSQDEPASVKNTVLYITPASPNITNDKCQPLGRLTWMAKGIIIREADIYSDTGCQYLLFIENNKPVAANAMAPEGAQFFNNIISQVEQRKKQ